MSDNTVWREIPTADALFLHGQSFLGKALGTIYDSLPDGCFAGRISAQERQKALRHISYARSLHGLPPVEYDCRSDDRAQKTAMHMALNGEITHNPPPEWNCFDHEARRGAANSNLFAGRGTGHELISTGVVIARWLTDEDTENCGHRRWLLDPHLRNISFGRYDVVRADPDGVNRTVCALDVQTDSLQVVPPKGMEFVAYPYGDYPDILFRPAKRASFSVVAGARREAGAAVDFGNAAIAIAGPKQRIIPVSDIRRDNDKSGLPNCLSWIMKDLEFGVAYEVQITNVAVRGETRSFSYSFRIIQAVPVRFPGAEE